MNLYPYQWAAVRDAADHLLNGEPSIGIVAPTGAGKSTIITALLNLVMPRKVAAFVAAPQQAIERGFAVDPNNGPETLFPPLEKTPGKVSVRPIGTNAIYTVLRNERGKQDLAQTILRGVDPTQDDLKRCVLTTHQQLTYWGTDGLLDDMTGRLLILDEAHHAGSSEEEKRMITHLGKLADTWRVRGGQVVYVTATPYRNDGQTVMPEGTKAHSWTIAQHSREGYAPSNFSLATIATGIEVANPTEYSGDDLPDSEDQGGTGYAQMVDQWVRDGKPKTVFIVPAKNSANWATNLEHALIQVGARVCNAVGTDDATRERFMAALDVERKAKTYADSQTDVFLACKRYDEGTDWALCSHVYQWGVPSSFGLIIQRWGRAFRSKKKYADYPAQFREEARLTFFIPKIRAGAEDLFKQNHHEHSWLLGAFLADAATGRQYQNSLALRYECVKARQQNPAATSAELVTDLFGDSWDDLAAEDQAKLTPDERASIAADQAMAIPDHRRAEALELMAQAEVQGTKADGTKPTVEEVLKSLKIRGFSEEVLADVRHLYVERMVEGHPEAAATFVSKVETQLQTRDPLSGFLVPDLEGVFREIVDQYGHMTVPVAAGVIGHITQFTGEDALEVTERLKTALNKPDFTEEILERAVRDFYAKEGRTPTRADVDATPYFGWNETWRNVDNGLRLGLRGLTHLKGSSLFKYAESLGLVTSKPDFTEEILERAVRAFHAKEGKAPTVKSGDASPYFGWDETWANVDARIRNGSRGLTHLKGSSLAKYAENLGLKDPKPDFTEEILERAVRAFHAQHGKAPTVKSGDASPYFGWNETWVRVEANLRLGLRGIPHLKGSSLSRYTENLGLKIPKPIKPDFTEEVLGRAVRAYHAKEGKIPNDKSGDASPYFGWPETWLSVDICIKRGLRGISHLKGSSLSRYIESLGLKTIKPALTKEVLERAVRAFHAKHGKAPNAHSGDASPYFGWDETWSNVEGRLKTGGRGLTHLKGSSLSRYAEDLGLKTSKPDFTEEILERAVRAFHAKEGETPKANSGDASPYFGWDETWSSVEGNLKTGGRGFTHLRGSSLFRYAESLGLVTSKPDFTEEILERAVRAFHAKEGKTPTAASGDASPYFGWDETWSSVEGSFKTGGRGLTHLKGSSLSRYAEDLGLKASKPDFTEEVLERAVRAFHAKEGKAPTVKSGDASPYFGWDETWKSVDHCLRKGSRGLTHLRGSSLSRYAESLGLVTSKPDFTEEILERAVRAYHAEHGTAPSVLGGDASPYFGWPETWISVEGNLKTGGRGLTHLKGSSLFRYAESLGLVTSKPDFTEEILGRAVRAFHAQEGKAPSADSGDASPYFGWDETWKNVDRGLRLGHRGLTHLKGSSLSRYAESLGLKASKPDFTEEILERAVRAFHAKEGKAPTVKSGDASPYFGWIETWVSVNQCLVGGLRGLTHLKGSSLSRYAKGLGLNTPGMKVA